MVWAQFCSSGLLHTTIALPGAACEYSTGHGVVPPHFIHLLSLHSSYLEYCLHPCYPHIRAQAHRDWHVFESRSAHVHLIPRTTLLITPYSPQSHSRCMNRLKVAKLLPHLIFNCSTDRLWCVQHLAHKSSTSWRHNIGLAITWFKNLWFLSYSFRTI